MKENYRMIARTGDIVLMPNGSLGIINHWGIVEFGHVKEVRVYPFTNWIHRIFLTLTGKIWFYNEQIDKLKPIHLAPRP